MLITISSNYLSNLINKHIYLKLLKNESTVQDEQYSTVQLKTGKSENWNFPF